MRSPFHFEQYPECDDDGKLLASLSSSCPAPKLGKKAALMWDLTICVWQGRRHNGLLSISNKVKQRDVSQGIAGASWETRWGWWYNTKLCRDPASVTCHVFFTKKSEGLFVCLFVMFYPHFLKLCLSWLFVTFDPHFLKRSFCPILNCTHIKSSEPSAGGAKRNPKMYWVHQGTLYTPKLNPGPRIRS